jgi:hypothetical protein
MAKLTPKTNSTDPQVRTLNAAQRIQALDYAKQCANAFTGSLSSFRSVLQYRDRAYMRQLNQTAKQLEAVRSAMQGDTTIAQDITVPVIMPQIESAVAYQAGVFLTSYPIFGVVASPANQDVATMFEATLAKQGEKFGWAREMLKTFRNGMKYNFGPMVVDWTRIPIQKLVNNADLNSKDRVKMEQAFYQGNSLTSLDPYNCFMDTLCAPCDIPTKGEFFGWNDLMSRIQFKRFVGTLDPHCTYGLKHAFESGYSMGAGGDSSSAFNYYVPQVNRYFNMQDLVSQAKTNWASWAGLEKTIGNDIDYRDRYLVTTLFCRACPSDFGGYGNIPQIYKLVIVNWQHVVYAERLIVAHDYLPVVVMQPNEDGLGYQTQSMLDNSIPYQDMATAMWNTTIESQRRKVYDRLVYNPHYIDKKNVDPAASVSRIPVKNAGMLGFDIQKALYKIPYDDPQPTLGIQASQLIGQMADEAAGQNRVARGQFQKGNKTSTEFETTMDGSNNRQQLQSLTLEHQSITPIKEIIRSNTLQNQAVESILNRNSKEIVEVDPVALRETILEFNMTDGVLPTDKLMSPQVMQVFMQTAQAIPGAMAQYDVLGMFLYWCKLKGATWLNDFKNNPEQQQQALGLMQQSAQATAATPTDATQNAANVATAQAQQAQAAAAAQGQPGA